MKHGILFFFYMGRITMGARIAILPLIYLTFFQVKPFGVAYFTFLALLILSIPIAMIPAPSDRTAARTLNAFHEEHKAKLMDVCSFVNDESLLLVRGFEKNKDMWMRRYLGRDVVYPHPVAIGYVSHLDKKHLLIGKKTLLRSQPAEYILWHNDSVSEAHVTLTVDPENESVALLTVTHPSLSQPLTVYAKNDFRVRDLLAAMEDSAPSRQAER